MSPKALMPWLQELEEGLLFPRFRHILDVSATLTAQVTVFSCLYVP